MASVAPQPPPQPLPHPTMRTPHDLLRPNLLCGSTLRPDFPSPPRRGGHPRTRRPGVTQTCYTKRFIRDSARKGERGSSRTRTCPPTTQWMPPTLPIGRAPHDKAMPHFSTNRYNGANMSTHALSKRTTAFTLVELLVVVAIIA